MVKYTIENNFTVQGKRKNTSATINKTISLDGKFLCLTVGDANLDIDSNDEFIVAYETENGSDVVSFVFEKDRNIVAGEKITSVLDKIKSVFLATSFNTFEAS